MGRHSLKKKILFRADANSSIGIGDLVSFLNLSSYFQRLEWECHFLVRNYLPARALLNNRTLNYMVIDEYASIEQEVSAINQYLSKYDIKAIFLQINERVLSQYDKLRGDIFKACVCFNSGLPKGYDVVLSWDNNSASYFNLQEFSHTKFFLGPEYVVLPISFKKELIKQRMYKNKRGRLLIAMGGADEFNFTGKIVRKLNELKCSMEINIVLGAGYANLHELEKFLTLSSLKYHIVQNIKNMFSEYMGCDIAIGAGGLTASELVATRTPALLIALYEHQVTRCKYFTHMGWAKYLGYKTVEALTKEDLINFIPNRNERFDIKIEEVVSYINGLCS